MAVKGKKYTISFFNSRLISVISISLVLYLIGLILLMAFLGKELSQYVKENISVAVILNDDLSENEIRKLRSDFEKFPYVKSTEYISKEQAAQEMQRELGENPEEFLGFNPFHASIELRLKSEYAHPDSLSKIERRIVSETKVAEMQYRKDMIRVVSQNIRRIGLILAVLVVVLMVISFVLINNTIRLLIYSKRFIIYTMRLVGATPNFIRRPFLRHNIISGLIAGIFAIILLACTLYYMKMEFPGVEEMFPYTSILVVDAVVLVIGVLMSVVAAYFAVNRYLRMSRGKLYHI